MIRRSSARSCSTHARSEASAWARVRHELQDRFPLRVGCRAALRARNDTRARPGLTTNGPINIPLEDLTLADGRFFFLTHARVQPYVLVGAGFPWLTIKDGSFLENQPDAGVGDGSFRGYALNTEVGVTVYPHPQMGIVLGYGYRPIWFDRATGISDTPYELRPRFRESIKGVVFTTLVTF